MKDYGNIYRFSIIETMHGIRNTIDKFGYEYTNLKTIGRGTYGVVWLC